MAMFWILRWEAVHAGGGLFRSSNTFCTVHKFFDLFYGFVVIQSFSPSDKFLAQLSINNSKSSIFLSHSLQLYLILFYFISQFKIFDLQLFIWTYDISTFNLHLLLIINNLSFKQLTFFFDIVVILFFLF